MVYAIGLESNYFDGVRMVRSKPDRGLKRLADESGGGYFELSKTSDLAPTFTRVAQELHSQYVLGFAPPLLDGRVHRPRARGSDRPERWTAHPGTPGPAIRAIARSRCDNQRPNAHWGTARTVSASLDGVAGVVAPGSPRCARTGARCSGPAGGSAQSGAHSDLGRAAPEPRHTGPGVGLGAPPARVEAASAVPPSLGRPIQAQGWGSAGCSPRPSRSWPRPCRATLGRSCSACSRRRRCSGT